MADEDVPSACNHRCAARIGANELPDYVIDIIGAMAGLPVLRDADRRTGEKCFVKTNLL